MFGFLNRFAVNKGLALLLSSVALAVLCAVICAAVVRGRMAVRQILNYICKAVVAVAAAVLFGFLVSLIPVKGLWLEVVFYAALAVVLVASVWVYIAGHKAALRKATANSLRTSAAGTAAEKHALGWSFGICTALVIASAFALAMGWEFYLIMFPVAVAAVGLLLHTLLRWRLWYALCAIAIAAFAVCFLLDKLAAVDFAALPVLTGTLAAAALLVAALVSLTFNKR
ncbi:MAG: hypothetical protein J6X89_04000 [Bacteroidales bacterium]|nr:hypothetical protein [Bacteroidales bacterium]